MPIYEYKCSKCNRIFERLILSSQDELINCPICSSLLKKSISLSNFSLKETGFYKTDYKDNKKGCSSCNKKSCNSC